MTLMYISLSFIYTITGMNFFIDLFVQLMHMIVNSISNAKTLACKDIGRRSKGLLGL